MSREAARATTLFAAVESAAGLLDADPSAAALAATEILKKTPGQTQALGVLAAARCSLNDPTSALRLFESFAAETPNIAAIHYERGLLLIEMGDMAEAVAALSRALELEPLHPEARRALAMVSLHAHPGDSPSCAARRDFGTARLQVLESAARGSPDQLPRAESLLREWLNVHPTDISALQLLGSVYIRLSRHEEAEEHLSKAVDLAPDFLDARWMLAGTFYYRGNWDVALRHADKLLERNPEKSEYLELRSYALLQVGEFAAAIASYESTLSKHPTAESWKSYGHALKAVGRQQEAIAAYRKAITIKSDFGLAYWCLADLKTFRFTSADVAAMRDALERPNLTSQNRARFHFALGKALEDEQRYEESFAQYREANAATSTIGQYSAADDAQFVRRCKAVFTSGFFRERSHWGSAAREPIFVVGLPRSGTTLIEQILASHSNVEATSELQVLESVARRLSLDASRADRRYPELLQFAKSEEIHSAAEEYLTATRVYRKLNRQFFIDKMPNNFTYLGLVLLMLPNAKIIDARRHPLGSGLAIYKHYFAEAYSFAFDLANIGQYYRNYVELMAHFDAVMPGRVHRVFYEQMVANTEPEIRKLLDYCGLPFEEACLRFYESGRPVSTPSSEQVRRPIFADAAELWRRYEPWLASLKSALGDVLETYPGVPDFGDSVYKTKWHLSSAPISVNFTESMTAAVSVPKDPKFR